VLEGQPMNHQKRTVSLFVLIALFVGFPLTANAQLRKLNVAYTATSPYQAAAIIGKR
jgi:hypothetical protein